jgi:hypothetical protein
LLMTTAASSPTTSSFNRGTGNESLG